MSVAAHELGAGRAFVVVAGLWIDTVLDQVHTPLLSGVHQRALIELAFPPFEALRAIRITQQSQIRPGRRSCRARRTQCRISVRRSMAVHASDLDGLCDLTIDIAIAV